MLKDVKEYAPTHIQSIRALPVTNGPRGTQKTITQKTMANTNLSKNQSVLKLFGDKTEVEENKLEEES